MSWVVSDSLIDFPRNVNYFCYFVHRDELESLCRIYKKLVSNCQFTSRALAASTPSSIIAKPHAMVEVGWKCLVNGIMHESLSQRNSQCFLLLTPTSWEVGEITEIGGYFSGKDLCLSHEANLLARNVWLRDYMNMDIVHKFDTFAEFSVTEKEIVICLLL